MTVIFFILKLILKIVLIVLAVIAALVLLILFMPLFYQVTGKVEQGLTISFKVHWLFYAVLFHGEYKDKKVQFKLRIFGIPVFGFPRKEKKKKPKEKALIHKLIAKNKEHEKSSNLETERLEDEENSEAESNNTQSSDTENEINKKKNIFVKIKEKWKKLTAKMKALKKKINGILNNIKDERNKAAVKHILKEVRYLIKHYKPTKIKTNLAFSTGDPALTGKVTGVLSVFPFMYKKEIRIVPDFAADNAYAEGDFLVKGHIQIIHVVCVAVRLLIDKNFRRLIKRIRQ